MNFIYNSINWYMDLHIIFQVVIGFIVLSVLFGILDLIFGFSHKEKIKKITEKNGISEEKLKEIVKLLGYKYPKDLLKGEDDELEIIDSIYDVEDLHKAIANISKITEKHNISVQQLQEILRAKDYSLGSMRYDYRVDYINSTICPSCGRIDSFYKDSEESYTGDARFIGRKNIEDNEEEGVIRNMEVFERIHHEIYRCNKCDHKAEANTTTFTYDARELAIDGYRCPKCNTSKSVYLKNVIQQDRYSANKEVEETTSRGTKTRYIKVMKLIEEETYCCHNCDFVSVATVTRDLD